MPSIYLTDNSHSSRATSILTESNQKFVFDSFSIGNGETAYPHPAYAREGYGESIVANHQAKIQSTAQKYGIDADLLNAIIFLENAHGWYDFIAEPFGANASQRPANINLEIWGDLFNTTPDLMSEADYTIELAGALLSQITERLDHPTIQAVASLYQDSTAIQVTDYGLTVAEYYRTTPWVGGRGNELLTVAQQRDLYIANSTTQIPNETPLPQEISPDLDNLQSAPVDRHATERNPNSPSTIGSHSDDLAGPSFQAANFSTDLSSVLATADYTLSHDGVGDQENVVVTAYVDTNRNGIWDSGDAQVGHEKAYNLRDDENDNEEIELTGLREHLGDRTLFLTVQSDEVDEHVIVTDEVTVEAMDVNFTLDNFEWTPDGAETRVDYDISHDLDGDVSGVRVRWYADTNGNGTWDDGDDYLGYESAGILRDGEVDSEGETLEDLGDYDGQGDVIIFTTIEADGIKEHVQQEDVVDMGGNDGPDIDLSIEDITFREDRLLSDGQDVRADFVVVNSGSESTSGMDERTGIFWSADDHFDFNEDMMIDYDTHGTLYAGERDSEYERTHYEDIPEGQGYLFYVVDPLDMIAETNEMNNVSDAYMVWVL